MPNRAVEIHDSVLAAISFSQGEVLLHFLSVYVHQDEDVPGGDPGIGWVQRAVLRIHEARMHGSFSEFPVNLTDAQIRMGENVFENRIPLPLHYKGAFELRLQAMWQNQVTVSFTGSGAELELLGEPKYVEEFGR